MTPLLRRIESNLLPAPDIVRWEKGEVKSSPTSLFQRIEHAAKNLLGLTFNTLFLPFEAGHSLCNRIVSIFHPRKESIELPLTETPLSQSLPNHFGFADSLFQTSGLGTSKSPTPLLGKSNWENWLNPKRIEGSFDYKECFVDVLKNPTQFIKVLKEMHVTAHRFSLEWSVIEPEPGKIDNHAATLYHNFIKALKKEKIEPYVTLHHFVLPEWAGDFDTEKTTSLFVSHSLQMMELFPEVTHWMTFNEPGVYAMQTRLRGVFPPGISGDLSGVGTVLRNLLIAHCKIYKEAKAKFGDKVQIGLTHQWLKFVPLKGNFLEEFICYFLSKMHHYSVYNFFKTGRFDFEVPFKANVHFEVNPKDFEEHRHFLDFIGVQFYGYPRLKAGWNGGVSYPGYKTMNITFGKGGLTFGSTCFPNEKMLSFGPGFHPESLQNCLEEGVQLQKPIAITEIGCDARVQRWGETEWKMDPQTQKEYFQKISPILDRFKEHLKAFFIWTLSKGHLEWDRGNFPSLGLIQLSKDAAGNITSYELSLAAIEVQKEFAKKRNLTRS